MKIIQSFYKGLTNLGEYKKTSTKDINKKKRPRRASATILLNLLAKVPIS